MITDPGEVIIDHDSLLGASNCNNVSTLWMKNPLPPLIRSAWPTTTSSNDNPLATKMPTEPTAIENSISFTTTTTV